MSNEAKMTERAEMLLNNSLDWYVVTLENGELELKHQTELSAILECGHKPEQYGFSCIERCWNREDLSTDEDWL